MQLRRFISTLLTRSRALSLAMRRSSGRKRNRRPAAHRKTQPRDATPRNFTGGATREARENGAFRGFARATWKLFFFYVRNSAWATTGVRFRNSSPGINSKYFLVIIYTPPLPNFPPKDSSVKKNPLRRRDSTSDLTTVSQPHSPRCHHAHHPYTTLANLVEI